MDTFSYIECSDSILDTDSTKIVVFTVVSLITNLLIFENCAFNSSILDFSVLIDSTLK